MQPKNLYSVHQSLLLWYEKNGRHDLPWRSASDVYHVYLSEVMLQQTQVRRVLEEYYFPFIERFPTLEALASAPLEDVFALWSGLGYYRRAKNLHESAKLCGGVLPCDVAQLMQLPGVGRYTAHAVCSFGYGHAVSVVDTNIARVLRRYFGLKEAKEAQLWEAANRLLNRASPTHHNLALMDLGSLVCLPKAPLCELCPLQKGCHATKEIEHYTQSAKKTYIEKNLFFGVCVDGTKVAMCYSETNMYKGMLTLPPLQERACAEEALLGSFKHSVTKYRLTIYLYQSDMRAREDIVWVDALDFASLPVSSMTKKALKLYEQRQKEKRCLKHF